MPQSPVHTPVESSTIKSAGYDREHLLLEIQFHSGGVYQYYGVLPEHYAALCEAASKGKHFHQHIRGKYTTVKLPEPSARGADHA